MQVAGKWMKAEITGEVSDILKRLHEGDATVGWLGDDTLTIQLAIPVDPVTERIIKGEPNMFEVWGFYPGGEPYVALRWPRCDASLLRELARRDVRTGQTLARFEEEVRKADKAREDKRREANEEFAEKAQWALRKDLGHLNGQTKMFHTVDGFKDKEEAKP